LADASALLDEPGLAGSPPVFVERTHPLAGSVRTSLGALRKRVLAGHEPAALEEALYALLEKLVLVERGVRRESRALSSLKATTRNELLRRLYRAREFMAASFDEPLSLSDLARVACLSPSHFLRTFRELFGSTPHAYLTALRVRKAKGLLVGGDSVTEICAKVGFESLGSFSTLFKREVGCSPAAFRKLIISDKTRSAREP
jgi:AraC-like DNA-binding protein